MGAHDGDSDEDAGGKTMGLGQDARMLVKADLCQRIDRLAYEVAHITPARLAVAVDGIRRTARDHDMRVLADLARGLENAIGMSGGATVVLPFLEAMSDAVGCDSVDPTVAQSYLASVGLRLHG